MKNKRKICLCLAVPLISFAILYGGGYAAQFIKNYKIWTSAGGTPGSSSPVKPTLNAIACFKAAFSLVSLDVGINPRFYRGKKKERSDKKDGELGASRKTLKKRRTSCKIVVVWRPHY